MNLEEIYYIGQTIAVVAILGSLGAIWLQMRQSNALAREETSRANLIAFVSEQQRLFSTPEDAAFMTKALYTQERLTADEKTRFAFSMALVFGLLEVGMNTSRSGLFRSTDFARAKDSVRLAYLTSPRARKWWANTRDFYAANSSFVALIDTMAAEEEANAVEAAKAQGLEAAQ